MRKYHYVEISQLKSQLAVSDHMTVWTYFSNFSFIAACVNQSGQRMLTTYFL